MLKLSTGNQATRQLFQLTSYYPNSQKYLKTPTICKTRRHQLTYSCNQTNKQTNKETLINKIKKKKKRTSFRQLSF
jgi:hypothetical protein